MHTVPFDPQHFTLQRLKRDANFSLTFSLLQLNQE